MAKVTLKDVARHAGVSCATVSRVLNHNPKVADDLRERVLAAIAALDYQPDRAARRLRAGTSDVLGLVISDIQNPFFISVVRGVEDAAYENQMSVVLCNTDEDPAKQQMYLDVMQAERVGGLIISPTRASDGPVLDQLRQANIPVILLDRAVEDYDFDLVAVDNVQGAYAAVAHLLRLGYQRVATISGALYSMTGQQRYAGYQQALAAHDRVEDTQYVKVGDFKTASGYHLAHELLSLPEPPDALFVANNLMTLGALQAIGERGITIPDELAVVGFDDMPWSASLCPPLTAVSQPTYELGQEAVRLLLRRRVEPEAAYTTIELGTRLVVRASCGAQ